MIVVVLHLFLIVYPKLSNLCTNSIIKNKEAYYIANLLKLSTLTNITTIVSLMFNQTLALSHNSKVLKQ